MEEVPKRKLGELLFLYNTERDLRGDIFVEGPGDKLIVDYYLQSRRLRGRVYTMDSIDFSGVNFDELGLPHPSARSAVIALCRELSMNGAQVGSMLFIVDRDQEDIVPSPHINGVHLTDAGALPVHIYDNDAESKVCSLVLKHRMSENNLKRSVSAACFVLYAARAASKRLGISAKILPPSRDLSDDGQNGFVICKESYLRRCLTACGNSHQLPEFSVEVNSILERMASLGRSAYTFINDHDLFCVLKLIIDKVGLSAVSISDVENMMSMSADANRLATHRLFCEIERIATA